MADVNRSSNTPPPQPLRGGATKASGFTLIEILVALAIFGSLLTFVFRLLDQVTHTQQLVDERQGQLAIANSILDRLSRELQLAQKNNNTPLMARPLSGVTAGGKTMFFIGQQNKLSNDLRGDTITFMVLEGGQALPGRPAPQGAVQITYRMAPDPDKDGEFILVREESPFVVNSGNPAIPAQGRTPAPIANKLLSFQASYLVGSTDTWTSEWGQRTSDPMPSMIAFIFTVAGNDGGKPKTFFSSVVINS